MKNEERYKKEREILAQLDFCQNLMTRLKRDIMEGAEAQEKDPYDEWHQIRNHTRYANDVIRIRRELMKLEKMLEG